VALDHKTSHKGNFFLENWQLCRWHLSTHHQSVQFNHGYVCHLNVLKHACLSKCLIPSEHENETYGCQKSTCFDDNWWQMEVSQLRVHWHQSTSDSLAVTASGQNEGQLPLRLLTPGVNRSYKLLGNHLRQLLFSLL